MFLHKCCFLRFRLSITLVSAIYSVGISPYFAKLFSIIYTAVSPLMGVMFSWKVGHKMMGVTVHLKSWTQNWCSDLWKQIPTICHLWKPTCCGCNVHLKSWTQNWCSKTNTYNMPSLKTHMLKWIETFQDSSMRMDASGGGRYKQELLWFFPLKCYWSIYSVYCHEFLWKWRGISVPIFLSV